MSQTYRTFSCNAEARTRKKKHYHLYCCHHCCCCCCSSSSNKEIAQTIKQKENVIDEVYPDVSEKLADSTKKILPCNDCVDRKLPSMTKKIPKESREVENTWLLNNSNNYLKDLKPWNRFLSGDKAISKLGFPSKYPWIQNTKSNILDKYYTKHLKEDFLSPVSGKTFDLRPSRIDSFDRITTSSLPDPIEVEDDIKYINHLEERVKVDLESRIMLDAVCDAILNDKRVREEPSLLVDDFDYTDEHEKTAYLPECSFLPRRDDILFGARVGVGKEFTEHSVEGVGVKNNLGHSQNMHQMPEHVILKEIRDLLKKLYASKDVASCERERKGLKKYSKCDKAESSCIGPQDVMKVSNKRTLSPTPSEPMKKLKKVNGRTSSGESVTKNVDNLFEKIDEIASKGLMNVERIQRVITGSNNKEQGGIEHRIDAEAGIEESVQESFIDSLDTSEIFHKIDEIIMRSKHNSDDIQNVLKTIPKKIEASQDYVNSAQVRITKFTEEEKREEDASFQLPIISGNAGEICIERESVVAETSKKKDDLKEKVAATKKKRKNDKKSLIPVKQTEATKKKLLMTK
ncbi:uncharacterized protein [Leptinotarsa decemlineata]|uniref:uncharacterized protein n=1 Tax=Leptinotarsa decemlineata TaxID=7539 RepID=UPI003D306FE9